MTPEPLVSITQCYEEILKLQADVQRNSTLLTQQSAMIASLAERLHEIEQASSGCSWQSGLSQPPESMI